MMLGLNNTPPLFVTSTRDFYVDIARHSLGSKITTITATDQDGDKIEYSLEIANTRDASPYFAVNSISGELRLANRPFVFVEPSEQQPQQQVAAVGGQSDSNDQQANDSDDLEVNDKQDESVKESDESTTSATPNISAQSQLAGNNSDQVNEQRLSQELSSPNLYFLNVAAFDGQYQSVLELKIHVYNSSYIFALQSANGGKPVQLTPDGSRKSNERLEGIIRSKANEFYASLQNQYSSSTGGSASNQQQQQQKSVLVYPDFMNPGLVKPAAPANEDDQSPSAKPMTQPAMASVVTQQQQQQQVVDLQSMGTSKPQLQVIPSSPQPQPSIIEHIGPRVHQVQPNAEQPLNPQPVIVSLVIICLCLMLALVILIFIVPISVKRLRRQIKQVQHDHLSQRDSHESTTMCSSSGASSSTLSGHLNHHHLHHNQKQNGFASTLSQFTLTSDRSMVCRQSSLDSASSTGAQTMLSNHHNYRRQYQEDSVPNPIYLNHNNQHFLHHQLVQPSSPLTFQTVFAQQAQPYVIRSIASSDQSQQHNQRFIDANNANEIYYPLEDEFYSTINTESVMQETPSLPDSSIQYNPASGSLAHHHQNHKQQQQQQVAPRYSNQNHNQYRMTDCDPPPPQPPVDDDAASRQIESRNSDSASSTRSLARFLSLPARHFRAGRHGRGDSLEVEDLVESLEDREENLGLDFSRSVRTIARNLQVDRDNNVKNSRAFASRQWELDRNRLKFLQPLGEGQFGLVWRCLLNGPSSISSISSGQSENQADSQVVAVKTLKKSLAHDERGQEELLAEIELMKSVCQHPNVVKILHCCTTDASSLATNRPILLVMEYVDLGKLQSYLEKSRNNHDYATNHYTTEQETANNSTDPLTSRDLVKFIYHVAKGMEYVASKCIVHRDLASRNILINSKRICKIGDFGMARHLQSLGGVYERHSRNTKIPVRWMAPEVILNNEFTIKSDVYSFGILMWEIVTLGSTPYKHLKTEQVKQEVAIRGERPDKPKYCHSMLYSIMSKCWLENSNERPTFSWLVKQFDELLLSANDYIELDQYPDHNYYNISKSSAPYELL